jgi:ribosome-associated heat shock protein Hsp15
MNDTASGAVQRIDQWLWFARIVKSRTLAQGMVANGKVRINRARINKPSASVRPGDVLTVMLGPNPRVFEVLALGARRGPAREAQLLFRDLAPPPANRASAKSTAEHELVEHAARAEGTGRPTKRERRQTNRLKGR